MTSVGIYIYEQAEVLDFSGPYEVFTTAQRVAPEKALFDTFLIAQTDAPVTARAGYQVVPHYSILNHPPLDVLVVVGGVHTAEMENAAVLQWIATQSQSVQLMASVCTGAFLLAAAGVISNQQVTTHWEDIADLKASFPDLEVEENLRWVDAGSIVTSGGISAGIDMSLHLVSRLTDLATAEATARQMEFRWSR